MKSYFCGILLLMYWLTTVTAREYQIIYEYCKWKNQLVRTGYHNDPPCGQIFCDDFSGLIYTVKCPKLTCDAGFVLEGHRLIGMDETKNFPDCCPRASCMSSLSYRPS